MIKCHWDNYNQFEHYGPGGFDMLGWDALNSGTLPLFKFEELDAREMRHQLLNSMPGELSSLASEVAITVERMRFMLANKTAARFSDLDSIVLRLFQEKEIDILGANGQARSRTLQRLKPTDRIAIPTQLSFPVFSRR